MIKSAKSSGTRTIANEKRMSMDERRMNMDEHALRSGVSQNSFTAELVQTSRKEREGNAAGPILTQTIKGSTFSR